MRQRKSKTNPPLNRYYHSADALYRVEVTFGAHVVVENCGNGELSDVPIAELRRWTPLVDGELAAKNA